MTKETRLESVLIRFDQDGNIKGAAAYDFEQDRDDATGEITPLRGELPARPIAVSDVDRIMSEANLTVAQNNLALQTEKAVLAAQVQTELTGRTAAETMLSAKDAEIVQLQQQIDAIQNPADPLGAAFNADERKKLRALIGTSKPVAAT